LNWHTVCSATCQILFVAQLFQYSTSYLYNMCTNLIRNSAMDMLLSSYELINSFPWKVTFSSTS
jgi:hypothetical protein